MSRYYNRKNNKKKFTNTKFYKTGSKILVVLLMLGVVGAMVSLLDFSWFKNDENEAPVEYKTVYLVPGDKWDGDSSNYLAYVWTDGSNQFVNPKYSEENKAWEFTFDAKYKSIIFVDLKEETNSIGLNWSNVREQSPDCVVPEDANVYYHQNDNVWSDSSAPRYFPMESISGITVHWVNSDVKSRAIYLFDKTGVKEPQFLMMNQSGNNEYIANSIPNGYTHVIFLGYSEEVSIPSWDNVFLQSEDIVLSEIILDRTNSGYYSMCQGKWCTYDEFTSCNNNNHLVNSD